MEVSTVTGPLPADRLGMTLIHEHFLFGYPGWYGDISVYHDDHEKRLEKAIVMAEALQAHGVQTVVDATTNETGRDPELLKEVSKRTGIHIICVTGYYYERGSAPAYFKARRGLGRVEDEIYEMFLAETTEGIGRTGIKAGAIKVASSRDGMTSYEQWFFHAAARACRETNIPIITHTQEGKLGPEQAEFFVTAGVDPKRVMIGHMCGNSDLSYHLKTLEYGVNIGFDRFGVEGVVGMPPDKVRLACLTGLVSLGYGDRIMISQDYVHHWLGRPGIESLAPNANPTHLFTQVIPRMRKMGITEESIRSMLHVNTRRFLAGQ